MNTAISNIVTLKSILTRFLAALTNEFRESQSNEKRLRIAYAASLSVVLAVVISLSLHLDATWWSGISAFSASQSSRRGSFTKALHRIIGTLAGGILAYFIMRWAAYDHFLCLIFLFLITFTGIIGYQLGNSGYAWLLFSITADLIVISSLLEPKSALYISIYRVSEVIIGSLVSAFVAFLVLPRDDVISPVKNYSWRDLLKDENSPVYTYALACSVTVAIIPLVWFYFELPSIGAQMGITSITILAVPMLGEDANNLHERILEKSLHRIIGCIIGGITGLIMISLPLDEFLPWLLFLGVGTWIGAYIQTSKHGLHYIGTQLSFAFIITLIQGFGPPDSIYPGLMRLSGVIFGIILFCIVSVFFIPRNPKTLQN